MTRLRAGALLFLLSVPFTGAQAGVPDYCAAYARDIADASGSKSEVWQTRYDNAEKACLFRFTTPEAKTAEPKLKPSKVKPVAAKKPAPKPKVVVEKPKPAPEKEPEVEKQAVKAVPLLKEGTKEWVAYCTKKYASFDADKGTYQSRTGVARKCKVTSDTVQR
jgi:outer membrane biosynthesis protein TonB